MQHGTIAIRGNEFVVSAPPHVSIRLRRVFGGAQRFQANVFTLAATPAHAYDLAWFRERHPLDLAADAEPRFRDLVAIHERKLEAIAAIDTAGYVPRDFELALPPREYQRTAAELALKTGSLLIADEVGVGKTVTAICALTAPGSLPALVVTMGHLARQWEREIARFAPALKVHRIQKGTPYEIREPGRGRKRAALQPDVYIINYHKLDGWADTLADVVRTAIFDEAQELRHSDSNKYRAAKAIAASTDLRIALTATPIYGYGVEIKNVMDVIAPDQLGSHKEFLDEWCVRGGGGGGDDDKARVRDPAALGTYLREAGLMIRRTRKDVGRELPALTVVRHVVECDQERLREATADVAELARRVLTRTGSRLERMQAAGELDYRMRQATGIAKAPAVADFVRLLVASGERVVLFGWHHAVYAIWRDNFDRAGAQVPYAMFTGEESEAEKDRAREAFIKGHARVLIISLRAGAGLDGLQHVCRTVVNGELDWSPAVHHQNVGRVHRDGQTEPVMAYYLVAEEGSDPVIADVLGIKEAQAQGIVDPGRAGEPVLVGASDDHIRRLAEDVLRREVTDGEARVASAGGPR